MGPVNAIAFSSYGQTLASASDDGTIKLWDAKTSQERATLTGHKGPVKAIAFSADGKVLASASFDGTIKLWDSEAKEGFHESLFLLQTRMSAQ